MSSDLALRKANIPVEGLFVLDLFFVDVVKPFDVAGQFSLNFLLVEDSLGSDGLDIAFRMWMHVSLVPFVLQSVKLHLLIEYQNLVFFASS